MVTKQSADILALSDTDESKQPTYEVAGLAGLIKGKFTEAEDKVKKEMELQERNREHAVGEGR